MGSTILGTLDFADRDEPMPTDDWRLMLTEWLGYQRHQFQRKLRDLSAEGLVQWSDDYVGGSADTVDADLQRYLDEAAKADQAIAGLPSLESKGLGHGRPLGAVLIKMIDEYALHSGQAHMLRYAALGEVVR